MNVKKYFGIIASALTFFAVTVTSCNKDETEDKDYLDGVLLISDGFKRYIYVNDYMTLYPFGVTHPEGKDLGFYYKTSAMSAYDTVYCANSSDTRYDPLPTTRHTAKFFVFAPDSLADFSIYAYVYASDSDNYWTSNTSLVFTAVDSLLSIPQIQFTELLPSFTDSRDSRQYNYVTLNGLDWMTKNLEYTGSSNDSGVGIPYMSCEAMWQIFGGFYTWTEAQNACPEGWRLPTNNEWGDAAGGGAGSMMVDAYFNGNKMWEFWPEVPINNTTGLSIIPTGYCMKSSDKEFLGSDSYACFWSGTTSPENSSQALYKYINEKENTLNTAAVDKDEIAMSVRCVRESAAE